MSNTSNTQVLRAIFILILAVLGFDVMAICVRLLQPAYSAAELSAYRNVLGVIPSLIVMSYMGQLQFKRSALRLPQWRLALLRGCFIAVAQLSFYGALGLMELATVSALAQTNGLFVVLLSIAVLGEKVGKWRWGALMLGFAGAMLILKPGSDAFSVQALLPIVAALFYGLSMVTIQLFDKESPNALIYLYASTASALASILFVFFFEGFSPLPDLRDAAVIFVMSMAGGCGVLLMMLAYRSAPPSALAPFQYFSILSAFFFGWAIFGELPIEDLFPGTLFIIGAGAIIIWRENFVKSS
ncbi:MAG: DMT family transporter [Paracoccaceae bacterium]